MVRRPHTSWSQQRNECKRGKWIFWILWYILDLLGVYVLPFGCVHSFPPSHLLRPVLGQWIAATSGREPCPWPLLGAAPSAKGKRQRGSGFGVQGWLSLYSWATPKPKTITRVILVSLLVCSKPVVSGKTSS